MTVVEGWNLASSIVSVILAVLAIVLSLIFYSASKQTESGVNASLTKIETQAEMLAKITGRQLDRLTKFATERPEQPEVIPQMIEIIARLPQTLTATISQSASDNEALRDELVACYMVMYFYSVQTNFWCQSHLPPIESFDPNNQYHALIKRILDMSAADSAHMKGILDSIDGARLRKQQKLLDLALEADQVWKEFVLSTSDVFVSRQKTAGTPNVGAD
jgi:hypothetical protein